MVVGEVARPVEVLVVGGGPGGYTAAARAAELGREVVLVERDRLGGVCLNAGCIPSKALITAANDLERIAALGERGISASPTLDLAGVQAWKRSVVEGLVRGVRQLLAKVEVVEGTARLLDPHRVAVESADRVSHFRFEHAILAAGSRPVALEALPVDGERVLDSTAALELEEVPATVAVVGGGYVGIELSQAMRRFGSAVSVIDRHERLMSREDDDVCEALRSLLEDEGIDLLLHAQITRVSGTSGQSVRITIEQHGTEKTLEGSHVLVAAGRTPNTEGLGLEVAGVEVTDRGYIKVNERLQTTAPGVWAIGEVAGSPQFTHISVDDFRVVHDNLIGVDHATTGRHVPYCLFTDPELARVGLSEHDAQVRGMPYRVFKVPMEANLRARTLSETRGFLKALVAADGDRILGFTAFGVGAAEMMSAVQIAMIAGLPYTALRDAVLTHPTLVEGLIPLFSSVASAHNGAEATRTTSVGMR